MALQTQLSASSGPELLSTYARLAASGGIGRAIALRDVLANQQDALMFCQGEEIVILSALFHAHSSEKAQESSDRNGLGDEQEREENGNEDERWLGFCEGVIGTFSPRDVTIVAWSNAAAIPPQTPAHPKPTSQAFSDEAMLSIQTSTPPAHVQLSQPKPRVHVPGSSSPSFPSSQRAKSDLSRNPSPALSLNASDSDPFAFEDSSRPSSTPPAQKPVHQHDADNFSPPNCPQPLEATTSHRPSPSDSSATVQQPAHARTFSTASSYVVESDLESERSSTYDTEWNLLARYARDSLYHDPPRTQTVATEHELPPIKINKVVDQMTKEAGPLSLASRLRSKIENITSSSPRASAPQVAPQSASPAPVPPLASHPEPDPKPEPEPEPEPRDLTSPDLTPRVSEVPHLEDAYVATTPIRSPPPSHINITSPSTPSFMSYTDLRDSASPSSVADDTLQTPDISSMSMDDNAGFSFASARTSSSVPQDDFFRHHTPPVQQVEFNHRSPKGLYPAAGLPSPKPQTFAKPRSAFFPERPRSNSFGNFHFDRLEVPLPFVTFAPEHMPIEKVPTRGGFGPAWTHVRVKSTASSIKSKKGDEEPERKVKRSLSLKSLRGRAKASAEPVPELPDPKPVLAKLSKQSSRPSPKLSPSEHAVSSNDYFQTVQLDGAKFQLAQQNDEEPGPARAVTEEEDEWGFVGASPVPPIYSSIRNASKVVAKTEQAVLAILSKKRTDSGTKKLRKIIITEGAPASMRYRIWSWLNLTGPVPQDTAVQYARLVHRHKVPPMEVFSIPKEYSTHRHFHSHGSAPLQEMLAVLRMSKPRLYHGSGTGRIAMIVYLQSFDVSQAYCLTVSILERFAADLSRENIRKDTRVLLELLREESDELVKHLESIRMDIEEVCRHWFTGLFTGSLPYPTAILILTMLLAEGYSYVLRTGLALMAAQHRRLMAIQDGREAAALLLQPPADEMLSPAQIMKSTQAYNISDEKLAKKRSKIKL